MPPSSPLALPLLSSCLPQVKGHIAKMALCLEDEDARISALAQLFFHELAKKEYKVRAHGRMAGRWSSSRAWPGWWGAAQ